MSATLPVHDLLPPPKAAEYVGVQEQTLAIWRGTGRYNLPFIKVGRLIRYRRSDLDKWLADRTVTQTS
jgi:excisionase family DNA binding protein